MATVTDAPQQTDAEEPTRSPLDAGISLAATVRSTLGPNGMDKLLIDSGGRVVVTNDGASILDRLEISDPIGRVLEGMVRSQKQAVGDGTTTTLLLTGELLAAAQSLRDDGFHPTTIIQGYEQATSYARERLADYAHRIDPADDALQQIATTAVTGRWDDQSTDLFASLAVSALRAVEFDPGRLRISAYPGGELHESQVLDGLLVDLDSSSTTIELLDSREFRTVPTPRIALLGAELTVETPDGVESVTISDPEQAAAFRTHDEGRRTAIVDRLRDLGATVVFCQKSIDTEIRNRLAAEGVLTVERTRQDEFDAIARSTGATIARSVDELTPAALGHAESIHRQPVGATDALIVSGCPEATPATLLLRGGTAHVSDEIERIMQTCTAVVQQASNSGSVLPGGGASAMAVATDLSADAESVSDREQLVIKAFADALTRIPRVLARNAGANPIDSLTALRTRHDAGESAVGIGPSGSPRDMIDAGVVEPPVVFDRGLRTALEATAMLLRIDSVNVSEQSDTETGHLTDHAGHDHGDHSHGNHSGGYPWALSH